MKNEKSCGAIISRLLNGNREILLIKHKNGGHWAFPKGHVEKGETEEETAIREIYEETGLIANLDTSFREVLTYSPKNDVTKDVVYFSATVIDTLPIAQPEEVEKISWLTVESAINHINFENDRNILQKYLKFINGVA